MERCSLPLNMKLGLYRAFGMNPPRKQAAPEPQKHCLKFNQNQTRDRVSVMSWNIQDSTGDGLNKFENSDFLTILKQGSIICLQETKKQVKIDGYMSCVKKEIWRI